MASNDSTPESVLNAPESTPVTIHESSNPSRSERRLMKIAESLNQPYEDPLKRKLKADRIMKLANRKGRHNHVR